MNLVESVKDSGGEAFIFSSMHVSGERECCCFFLLSVVLINCDFNLYTFVPNS